MQVYVKQDGFESVSYNHPEIPFYVRTILLSKYDSMRVLSHWHDELEFLYILKGHMWYHINEEILYLKEGDGLFVNSCQLHYGFSKDQSECQFIGLLFHPELISTNKFIEEQYILPVIHDASYPYVILQKDIPWQMDMTDLLQEAAVLENKTMPGLHMQLIAVKLMAMLQENLPYSGVSHVESSQQRRLLKKMIIWIREHYSEKIHLQQIADSADISKSFCGILFQKHTGSSPIEYLNDFRLQQAKGLLQSTEQTILEISLQTGFSGSSYFCELFKRRYGISPMQFRRHIRYSIELSGKISGTKKAER